MTNESDADKEITPDVLSVVTLGKSAHIEVARYAFGDLYSIKVVAEDGSSSVVTMRDYHFSLLADVIGSL